MTLLLIGCAVLLVALLLWLLLRQPKRRQWGGVTYMGLGAAQIEPQSVATILVKPARPITPARFQFHSSAQALVARELQIDPERGNLLSEAAPLPELEARGATFLFPTIDPASGIQFVIENPTDEPLVFTGCIYGTQVNKKE
jgi:hypothetical protein